MATHEMHEIIFYSDNFGCLLRPFQIYVNCIASVIIARLASLSFFDVF